MKRNKKLSARDLVTLLHTKAVQPFQYPVVKIGRSILLRETGRRNLSADYIESVTTELHKRGYACAWRTRSDDILGHVHAGYAVTVLYYSKYKEYVQNAILWGDWGYTIDSDNNTSGFTFYKSIMARNPTLDRTTATCVQHIFNNSRYGAKGEHYGDQESIGV